MKRYSAAVIGAGRIGMLLEEDPIRVKPATHAGLWLKNARSDLVGLCDLDPDLASNAGRVAPGVPCFSDPDRMLRETKPDIVSIATHHDSHVDLIRLCIAHGVRAVVCEKPISFDLEAAGAVVKEAEQAGMLLAVNQARRFDGSIHEAMERVHNGEIGDLLQVSGYYVFGLISTGTHLVDLINTAVMPSAGRPVWARGWTNPASVHAPDDDPCIDGVICYEKGLKAHIQSLSMKDYDMMELSVFGRRGKLVFSNLARRADLYAVAASNTNSGFTELQTQPAVSIPPSTEGYFKLMGENVLAALDGEADLLCTGADSLLTLRTLVAISNSSQQDGAAVTL